MSALIVQDMQARRNKDYEFNETLAFGFEGDTGPFLQYSHCRLHSIIGKFTALHPGSTQYCVPPTKLENVKLELLYADNEDPAIRVLQQVARYPDIVRLLMRELEPCIMLTYLFKLCHEVANCIDKLWVMNQETELAYARCVMYWCAKVVIGNGCKMLGLKPLERM